MPLGTEVGLGPGRTVLDGDQAAPPKKGRGNTSIFRPMSCGQTAGWIKMPLGTEVDIGPGHSVRFGPSSPRKGQSSLSPRISGPCILWPNGRPSQLLLSKHLSTFFHRDTHKYQSSLKITLHIKLVAALLFEILHLASLLTHRSQMDLFLCRLRLVH